MQDEDTSLPSMTPEQLSAWNRDRAKESLHRHDRLRADQENARKSSWAQFMASVAEISERIENCQHTRTRTTRAVGTEDYNGTALEVEDHERCLDCGLVIVRAAV